MRKLLCLLLIAGCGALALTPVVVSASGSQNVPPAEAEPEFQTPPVVLQLGADGERTGPGYLGVEVVELTEQLRLRFSVPEGRGILVSEVEPGSAAEAAGLAAGDVLVSLDSAPIASASELSRRVRSAGAGSTLPMVVIRDGSLVELSAELGARPERSARRQASRQRGWSEREWDDEELAERFEALGERLERAFDEADWERFGESFGEHWERSGEDWERYGEHWEQLGERLGERMEELGERLGSRFEELGERMEHHAERWQDDREHDWERSAEEWERFGEDFGAEMERFGEEWGRFGEELGRQFESMDWEAFSREISAAVEEAVGSVDWEQLGESIRRAVEHLDVHIEDHGR